MEHSFPDHQLDQHEGSSDAFDDLLANNKKFAEQFDLHGFDGVAHAEVLITMDSRIVPLEMVGLTFGDAKIIRTPGGRVSTSALAGCIAGVHLLQVNRIMVIPHSRCATDAADDDVIIDRIRNASSADASWVRFGASVISGVPCIATSRSSGITHSSATGLSWAASTTAWTPASSNAGPSSVLVELRRRWRRRPGRRHRR